MNFSAAPSTAAVERPALDLLDFMRELFPFPRSLTGEGVRETLRHIARHIPITIEAVPSGTPVLDWEVPLEWNIRSATIRSVDDRILVDFARSNLHVVGYSVPVHEVLTREELARHVHTLPEQPDLVPYRTGYFANDWGFCISHRQWESMHEPAYRVDIDSSLEAGVLNYGELFLPGASDDEVLVTVHICHPSLANDNLSGIAVATALALRQMARPRRLGYRFLFLPATIGAITWLACHEQQVDRIRHGLVLTCLGDAGPFHYKQSRRGAVIDEIVAHVLQHADKPFDLLPFNPYGYDERQFCSPGFDLPVGCFMRGVHGTFAEYHTSADNLEFVKAAALDESYAALAGVFDVIEGNRTYARVDGRGEPQLGRRGLYRAIAGQKEAGGASQMDLLWLLNLADGRHSLLQMAQRAQVPFRRIEAAASLALAANLIEEVSPAPWAQTFSNP